jgi:pimeloyl-ACP methyl ester carboxylesterase
MENAGAGLVYATAPDGATIAAEVIAPTQRAAATLLFVPGLGYGPWSWVPQRTEFAAEYRLVLLHNRGTGRSVAPPGPYSIGTLADDAAAVLRTLGVRRAHVLGASMGGYVSLQLARAHPDLVAATARPSARARAGRRDHLVNWRSRPPTARSPPSSFPTAVPAGSPTSSTAESRVCSR